LAGFAAPALAVDPVDVTVVATVPLAVDVTAVVTLLHLR